MTLQSDICWRVLKHCFDILSGISSRHSFFLAYLPTFFPAYLLTFFLPFFLAYLLPFYLGIFCVSSEILSDILSGVLSGISISFDSQLRFSGEHCRPEAILSWQLRPTLVVEEDEEKQEEEEENREAADIKSNNPHLTGGGDKTYAQTHTPLLR